MKIKITNYFKDEMRVALTWAVGLRNDRSHTWLYYNGKFFSGISKIGADEQLMREKNIKNYPAETLYRMMHGK